MWSSGGHGVEIELLYVNGKICTVHLFAAAVGIIILATGSS